MNSKSELIEILHRFVGMLELNACSSQNAVRYPEPEVVRKMRRNLLQDKIRHHTLNNADQSFMTSKGPRPFSSKMRHPSSLTATGSFKEEKPKNSSDLSHRIRTSSGQDGKVCLKRTQNSAPPLSSAFQTESPELLTLCQLVA